MTLGCIPRIPNVLEVPIQGLFILWGFPPPLYVAAKLKGEETSHCDCHPGALAVIW